MKKVLKIVAHQWGAASRDRKELAICRELGCEISVMQKGDTKDKGRHEVIHGFDVYDYSTRPLGNARLLQPLNRFISLFTWAHYARKFKPDIISGHDYIALFIGWMSTTFIPKKKRPKLVYDSHEFELGRNKKRSKLAVRIVKCIEGFLIKRCAFAIVFSDAVADRLVEIYKCKRPVPARNIPLYWNIDEDVINLRHREQCAEFGLSEDGFYMLYHGGIMENRGVEMLLKISADYSIPLLLLGNPVDERYYDKTLALAEKLKARVIFKRAVPLEELWQYVGAANVEMIVAPALCESYYLGLPNKLFESIQSLTPLITSNYPDLKRIVEGCDVGLTVDSSSEEDIVNAIFRLMNDKELYARFKANLRRAKDELCWEKEKKALYDAYRELIG